MRNSVKAVLFDLDDTLYDESTFVASGFRAVATYLANKFGVNKQEAFSKMMVVLMTEGRGKIFNRVLEDYGLCSPNLVAELVEVYRSHKPTIHLYPDVRPTFQILRKYGIKLGIITNGLHIVQKRKIIALGLQDLVDIIVYADELGREYWKPHPAVFQRATTMLNVEPSEVLYVGNDSKDFVGPNSIGIFTIHLCRGGMLGEHNCEARVHISSLIEILRIISTDYNTKK